MIKPTELRVGNPVNEFSLNGTKEKPSDRREVKISSISEGLIDWDKTQPKFNHVSIEPIPITEDRVKRSFESSGNLFDMRLYKIGIVRVTFVDAVASVSLKVSAAAPYFRLKHIKHLHQLQNLVLDLCQEEISF